MATRRWCAENQQTWVCENSLSFGCYIFHDGYGKHIPFGTRITTFHEDHTVDKMRLPVRLITPALLADTSLAAFYYPTPQAAFLEHILVDNWGAYASNFSSAITPCSNYVTEVGEPAVNSGRTTAAQWMRVAFHDFVTADIGAGTGGIDASIGFETERGENSGSAFNDSFTFWAPFVNDVVSSKFHPARTSGSLELPRILMAGASVRPCRVRDCHVHGPMWRAASPLSAG